MQLHLYTGTNVNIGKTLTAILSMRALNQLGGSILVIDGLDVFKSRIYEVFEQAGEDKRLLGNGNYEIYRVKGATATLRICRGKLALRNLSELLDKIIEVIDIVTAEYKAPPDYVLVDASCMSFNNFAALNAPLKLHPDVERTRIWINWDLRGLTYDSACKLFWQAHNQLLKYTQNTATLHRTGPHDPFVHVFGPRSWKDVPKWSGVEAILGNIAGNRSLHQWIFETQADNGWIGPQAIVPQGSNRSFGQYLRDEVLSAGDITPETIGQIVADYWFQQGPKPQNALFIPYDKHVQDFGTEWVKRYHHILGFGALDRKFSTLRINNCRLLNAQILGIF